MVYLFLGALVTFMSSLILNRLGVPLRGVNWFVFFATAIGQCMVTLVVTFLVFFATREIAVPLLMIGAINVIATVVAVFVNAFFVDSRKSKI
jgi:hypothetical protein